MYQKSKDNIEQFKSLRRVKVQRSHLTNLKSILHTSDTFGTLRQNLRIICAITPT